MPNKEPREFASSCEKNNGATLRFPNKTQQEAYEFFLRDFEAQAAARRKVFESRVKEYTRTIDCMYAFLLTQIDSQYHDMTVAEYTKLGGRFGTPPDDDIDELIKEALENKPTTSKNVKPVPKATSTTLIAKKGMTGPSRCNPRAVAVNPYFTRTLRSSAKPVNDASSKDGVSKPTSAVATSQPRGKQKASKVAKGKVSVDSTPFTISLNDGSSTISLSSKELGGIKLTEEMRLGLKKLLPKLASVIQTPPASHK